MEKYIELLQKQYVFGEEINAENILFGEIGLMPKKTVYKIYKRRSKHNPVVSTDFVRNIENFSGNEIMGVTVVFKGKNYLMVTDKNGKSLIGIIGPLTPKDVL